jgi:glycopeptide antibiotics resistance protein
MEHRTGVLAIGALYAVGLMLLAFTPISWVLSELTLKLYIVGAYELHLGWVLPEHYGYLLNVLLFVPFGALVVLIVRWPWWAAALVATAASAAIEVVQYLPVLHRQATLADVICNGLGALLGAVLAHISSYDGTINAPPAPPT